MATPTPLRMYWVYQKHRFQTLQAALYLHQPIDYTGRPSSGIGAGVVRFVVDSADAEARLADYMFDSYRRAHSHFEVEYDSGSTKRWLEVQAAYLVRLEGQFEPGRPDAWPASCVHLGLSAAALVKQGITLERHSVLPWNAPPEVQRRARMEGLSLPAAEAMPRPRGRPLRVEAPPLAPPPALADNSQKGVYGEHVSDTYMRAQGHHKLNDGGLVTPPPPGGTARGNGLDGVWKHHSPPPDYIITEAKYDTSRLGMTHDGKQMSDTWILGSERLEKAVGRRKAIKIRTSLLTNNVEKRIHKVSPSGIMTESIIL